MTRSTRLALLACPLLVVSCCQLDVADSTLGGKDSTHGVITVLKRACQADDAGEVFFRLWRISGLGPEALPELVTAMSLRCPCSTRVDFQYGRRHESPMYNPLGQWSGMAISGSWDVCPARDIRDLAQYCAEMILSQQAERGFSGPLVRLDSEEEWTDYRTKWRNMLPEMQQKSSNWQDADLDSWFGILGQEGYP